MGFSRVVVEQSERFGELEEAGYEDHGPFASYPRLAAKLLRERGLDAAVVSPKLQAGYLEELRSAGLDAGARINRNHLGRTPAHTRDLYICANFVSLRTDGKDERGTALRGFGILRMSCW